MSQWRWTLCEEFENGVTNVEQHAGQRKEMRDAMDDIANTVRNIKSIHSITLECILDDKL